MTSKLSWIGFIPFAICAIGLKFVQMFFMNDASATLFGLTALQLSYVAMGIVILVLIITMIFCFTDRKISPYYNSKRNIFCGIFAIILALMFAADGANKFFNMIESASFSVIGIIEAIFLLLSAIAFVVIGMSGFFKENNTQKFLIFLLMPAILMAVRLISCFMTFRTLSIVYSDVPLLLCYIFATMFLFNYAVLMSKIEARSPVKSCFIYGFPMLTALLMYALPNLYRVFTTGAPFEFFSNLENLEFLVIALFALGFIVELSVNVKRKDEVEIINETVNEDKDKNKSKKDSKNNIDNQIEDGNNSLVFDMDEDEDLSNTPEQENNKDSQSDKQNLNDFEGLKTESVAENLNNDNLKIDTTEKNKVQTLSQEKKAESRMDEIDRLILEISSEDNDK